MEALEAIASTLKVPASSLDVERGRGGNSRVYFVTLAGKRVVAKQYFRHPADPRDRLRAEWDFLEYAAAAGMRCVPRPLARDTANGIGVYQYIEGRPLDASDVTAARVAEAADFFLLLNRHRDSAKPLGAASEACFSVAEHLAMVDGRVARLAGISSSNKEDRAAREFATTLERRWREVRESILKKTLHPSAPVEERCISPSDFGFHNALLRESGELCFLDFEYAGWDDPAKTVGDFFAHPGLPVPHRHFDAFVKTTMGFSSHAAALEARARLLEPVFRIKWCCIILNEFVPDAAQRRRFATPGADAAAVKRQQLDKARGLLASV